MRSIFQTEFRRIGAAVAVGLTIAAVCQPAAAETVSLGMVPQLTPPAKAAATPVASKPSDTPEPASERAAAAAARAARALADEQGVAVGGGDTGGSDLVPADAPAVVAEPVTDRDGQGISAADKRRATAAAKCVAGC